jgi:hypothetical protein
MVMLATCWLKVMKPPLRCSLPGASGCAVARELVKLLLGKLLYAGSIVASSIAFRLVSVIKSRIVSSSFLQITAKIGSATAENVNWFAHPIGAPNGSWITQADNPRYSTPMLRASRSVG